MSLLTVLADENMPMVDDLFGSFCWIERKSGRDICRADLAEVDILLVRSITQVDQELLQDTPVKFVGSATIGLDHVDVDYLKQQDIQFAYAAGCNAQAVAEYVLTAIAYWANKRSVNLANATVGIIGAGNVGSQLSQLLQQLGIKYLLNDPPLAATSDSRDFVELQDIQHCDVVTCHVPLKIDGEYATQYLIDSDFLQAMQGGSLLVNSSRGAVVNNQDALKFKAWNQGVDYIFDVWEGEPDINQELLDACLLATPHIAGYSLEGKVRGTYMLYRQLRDWLGKETGISLSSKLPRVTKWSPPKYLEDLHQSLIHHYDILADDQALRAAKNGLPDTFDHLRKNYKTRLEFWKEHFDGAY
ncbi:4-phosphoerythronate dehydrogenase [Kangiella sp. TOML190]|uniref:4-phosphoerythronate dehydrogenase n=1 Tax=Kangiella sp. TOML190 TaxID=2931351 RepID=UPI00203AC81B|nr:4-phosphoerythronate dehydrogenase [Kangiella sp. TOML190]